MKKNKAVESSLRLSIKASLVAAVAMLTALYMSYLAESFEQEIGMGRSILGYNRDWLVDGRWWFAAAFVLCICMILYSFKKLVSESK